MHDTIMDLGATGAGKSTLINGMINYILGVKWEDSYRFVLVNEDQSLSQAHSQTPEVYHQEDRLLTDHCGHSYNHLANTFSKADPTGRYSNSGLPHTETGNTEQICNLFTAQPGVAEIDAVCFVAPASLARLTPTQKYVFDSVFSIFGKDVAENIRILVTFADGQRLPVLQAISVSGIPCPKDKAGSPVPFKFHNLFADNKPPAAGRGGGDDSDEN
ncbi:uncharacterized protein LOC121644995 [Melanotaenia boesemani]|uniref:uncharacterized protein LOC121644995 n=1 Tax=Melanotaenia boesemani TaxID=1250792 RepID=UPI001C04E66D|nr:uncharacterized protein LOC121644995 [Melanotaenia boesemani]